MLQNQQEKPFQNLYDRCDQLDSTLTLSELNIIQAAHPEKVTRFMDAMKEREKVLNPKLEYFTPSIEDIRVGYELEMNLIDEFTKQTVSNDNLRHTVNIMSRVPHLVRVPYLTKEQIRDDSWKVITPSSNLTKEGVFYFEKGNYFLIADFSRPIPFLDFILRDPSKDLDKVGNPERFRFYCECKDINTFRYICKLLNI